MVMNTTGEFRGNKPHERQDRPDSWTHDDAMPTPSISLKFHHCISWDSLRDVWQALQEHDKFHALESYMTAVGVKDASAARKAMEGGTPLPGHLRDDIYARISWPGWNIVQGPGERTDEGGAAVDLFTYGMKAEDKARMGALSLVWDAMGTVLKAVNQSDMRKRRSGQAIAVAPSPGIGAAGHALTRAFSKMAAYKDASYIPYTQSMWDTITVGVVKKDFPALWDWGVPSFRKATQPANVIGNLPKRMRCMHPKCNGRYDTPKIPVRCKVWCKTCGKTTSVDYQYAVV